MFLARRLPTLMSSSQEFRARLALVTSRDDCPAVVSAFPIRRADWPANYDHATSQRRGDMHQTESFPTNRSATLKLFASWFSEQSEKS
jgi:hypothetical protein